MTSPESEPESLPDDYEPCVHDWNFVDASFDHEFGTERVRYDECSKCGATRDHEPSYFEDLHGE